MAIDAINQAAFVFKEKKMQIGDIISRKDGNNLRSGCFMYASAVVISLDPFAITSEDGDMLWWTTIKKEDFKVVGKVNESLLKIVMKRLEDIKPLS